MRFVLGITVLVVLLAGCGHKKHAVHAPAPPALPQNLTGYTETGIASWYGHPYHGRQAADGEIYDMETLVAAHRILPFQAWVRVTNLSNGKSVEVRIIDRGPFVAGRIIDLSHAAAREIGLIGPGIAQVRVEVTRTPPVVVAAAFGVQVGAFREPKNAEALRAAMATRYGAARIVTRQGNPPLYRVLVGSVATEAAAVELATRIRTETSEKNGFVVRLDP
jgi:rare lipoprotein A